MSENNKTGHDSTVVGSTEKIISRRLALGALGFGLVCLALTACGVTTPDKSSKLKADEKALDDNKITKYINEKGEINKVTIEGPIAISAATILFDGLSYTEVIDKLKRNGFKFETNHLSVPGTNTGYYDIKVESFTLNEISKITIDGLPRTVGMFKEGVLGYSIFLDLETGNILKVLTNPSELIAAQVKLTDIPSVIKNQVLSMQASYNISGLTDEARGIREIKIETKNGIYYGFEMPRLKGVTLREYALALKSNERAILSGGKMIAVSQTELMNLAARSLANQFELKYRGLGMFPDLHSANVLIVTSKTGELIPVLIDPASRTVKLTPGLDFLNFQVTRWQANGITVFPLGRDIDMELVIKYLKDPELKKLIRTYLTLPGNFEQLPLEYAFKIMDHMEKGYTYKEAIEELKKTHLDITQSSTSPTNEAITVRQKNSGSNRFKLNGKLINNGVYYVAGIAFWVIQAYWMMSEVQKLFTKTPTIPLLFVDKNEGIKPNTFFQGVYETALSPETISNRPNASYIAKLIDEVNNDTSLDPSSRHNLIKEIMLNSSFLAQVESQPDIRIISNLLKSPTGIFVVPSTQNGDLMMTIIRVFEYDSEINNESMEFKKFNVLVSYRYSSQTKRWEMAGNSSFNPIDKTQFVGGSKYKVYRGMSLREIYGEVYNDPSALVANLSKTPMNKYQGIIIKFVSLANGDFVFQKVGEIVDASE